MPSASLKPNNTKDEEFFDFDLEAVPAEDDVAAGLALTVQHGDDDSVDVWETDAESIRAFRDLVVQECDKALSLIEG